MTMLKSNVAEIPMKAYEKAEQQKAIPDMSVTLLLFQAKYLCSTLTHVESGQR